MGLKKEDRIMICIGSHQENKKDEMSYFVLNLFGSEVELLSFL